MDSYGKSKALARKDFLQLLARSRTAKKRKLLAEWADKSDLDAVSECMANVLKGNVHLKPRDVSKLRCNRNALRSLARKKTSSREKRKTIHMRGGFLGTVLPLAISALTSIIPRLIKKNRRKRKQGK